MSRSPALSFRVLLYGAIVVVALALRFVGLDWGPFHPDEWAISSGIYGLDWPSSIANALSADSPLNPKSFNYGSLPIYVLRVSSETGGWLRGTISFIPSDVVIWRALSGVADVATLVLSALIARRLFGELAGLLAALLYAVAVLPIQLSHFHAVDPLMNTFLTGAAGAALVFVLGGSVRWGFGAAALAGLAVATKATAVLFVAPVVLAWFVYLYRERRRHDGWSFAPLATSVGAVLLAFVVFAVGQPYAVLDWVTYRDDVLFQAQMARGAIELPFTIQYLQTTPFLYHLRNLVVWGLGWPLGVVALFAVVWLVVRGMRKRDAMSMLLAAGVVIPFVLLGGQQVKFMRYLLPLYPLLIIGASGLLAVLVRALWSRGGRRRWVGVAVMAGVAVPTCAYGVGFATIYTVPHTAHRMAEWVDDHVPMGATIAIEAWDQWLPGSGQFRTIQVHPYNSDDERKVEHLTATLHEADYVFLFSNRAYGALSRLPERYPLMREYYRQLLTGGLGFEVAHVEATYPTLLGITVADQTLEPLGLHTQNIGLPPYPGLGTLVLGSADESFTVYDHPLIILLKKRAVLDQGELRSRLEPAVLGPPASTPPGFDPLLTMTPARAQAQREGGTWTGIFAERGLSVVSPLFAWILAVQAIALIGLPLTVRVFRALPDRGYLLGKTLSLLLVAYIAWLLVSVEAVSFTRVAVGAAIAALGVASAVVGYATRRQIIDFVRERWRLLLTMEMLFLVAFLALVVLRAANPDLWHSYRGGEKPMDLSYLTAVVRSTHLPPYDPWFAGGFLNYYYFGQFIVAVLIHLTGIVPEVAYNLAVPLLWALTLGGCVSVVYNLVEASNMPVVFTKRRSGGAIAAGMLAAALVGLAGNLDGALQVFQRFSADVGHGVITSAAQAVFGGEFDYWRSSRMIDVPGSISITEFPFFTFLFADLHAHLIAMPITLVAAGLALAAALAVHRRLGVVTRLAPLAGLGLAVGALFATNAWDSPTYLLVGVGAVAIAYVSRGTSIAATATYSAVILGTVILIAIVAFAPYHASNVAFYTDLARSPEQTPFHSYVAIFGAPLFVLVAALIVQLRRGQKSPAVLVRPESPARLSVFGGWHHPGMVRTVLMVAGASVLAAFVWAAGYEVVSLNGVLIIAIGVAMRSRTIDMPTRLAFGAAALALALIAGVDVYAIDDRLVRMNTIFRVYLQAWVLLNLAAGFLVWRLWRDGAFRRFWRSPLRTAFAVALAMLAVAVTVYPVQGTRARLSDRLNTTPLTLDGLAFANAATYRDVGGAVVRLDAEIEGIEWLRHNVVGSPVVAEAALLAYPDDVPYFRVLSRVAMYTGLPTVIGWPWHQTQQRGIDRVEPTVNARLADVRRLYSAGDPTVVREVVARYNVEYVVVGQLERLYYPPEGLSVFDAMPELERHDINDVFTIFRVSSAGPA